MRTSGMSSFVFITLFAFALAACSVDPQPPSRNSGTKPLSGADAERDGATAAESDSGESPDAESDGSSKSTANPSGLDISTSAAGKFVNFGAKADDYNIVLIFDSSGSRTQTDPTSASRDGALKLVEDMAEAVGVHQNVTVHLAIIAFAGTATVDAIRWHELSHTKKNTDDINTAIESATLVANQSSSRGTDYLPPLALAKELLKEQGADPNKARQRNYIVFLTDGMPTVGKLGFDASGKLYTQPSKEYRSNLAAAISGLVTDQGVAFMAIAAGSAITTEGAALVKGMALPAKGTVDAAHVGKFVHAKSAAEMKEAWDILLLAIAS